MPHTRPLTSQEIDDGWCLEEEPEHGEYVAYELIVSEPAPEPVDAAFGLSEAFTAAYRAYAGEEPLAIATS